MRKLGLILCALLTLGLSIEQDYIRTFPQLTGEYLQNVRRIYTKKNIPGYTVSDLTYEKTASLNSDLILSFNTPSEKLIRDDTGTYKVLNSDFLFSKDTQALGKGCAHFFLRHHGVTLKTEPELFLGSQGQIGSFTIEFRFKPLSFNRENILFSRIGYLSGSKVGIELLVKNNRLVARFLKVFEGRGYRKFDIFLNRSTTLKTGNWYHGAITYNAMTGKLAKYLNGREEEVLYVTKTGTFSSAPLPAYFGYKNNSKNIEVLDLPPVHIGKNYLGYIDEVRLSTKSFSELQSSNNISVKKYAHVKTSMRMPLQPEGVIQSPVYNFKDTGTKITEFTWEQKGHPDTFIWMEFRIADQLFDEDNAEIKWFTVKKGQRGIFLKKLKDGAYLRGKHFQWRAHLLPSPDGRHAPVLWNLKLSYQPDRAPARPRFPELVKADEKSIVLRWKKNVESDIHGYKIYYGIKPGIYDGVIDSIKGKKITNSINSGDYITITLSNDIIEENRNKNSMDILTYPLLSNTNLYYFSISAYDNYRPDTSFKHESKLSKTITARLFHGSHIDGD